MLTAIDIVWAVMLWRASNDPARHLLFIDFSIWANAAHGLVMIIATPIQKGPVMTVIEAFRYSQSLRCSGGCDRSRSGMN